jgi:hypothetical protein
VGSGREGRWARWTLAVLTGADRPPATVRWQDCGGCAPPATGQGSSPAALGRHLLVGTADSAKQVGILIHRLSVAVILSAGEIVLDRGSELWLESHQPLDAPYVLLKRRLPAWVYPGRELETTQ